MKTVKKVKTVNKIKEKKRKILKKPKVKTKKEKVLIVSQEIKFARLLSGNEKKTRDRVLKTFKKWLLNCFERGYEFKEDDFTRVWKGLFYAVWMSDKPLVQEELCETIAGILDLFPPEQIKYALLMTKAGLKVLATEWYGIDQHRMDKFMMLVRRYQRGSLRVLRRCGWSLPACKLYADMLATADGLLSVSTPLYARNAGSMLLHFVDCFLEELAKVSEGEIAAGSVTELLRPFCAYACAGAAPALCVACRRLLTALLRQTDQGLQYRERTRAWKQMGCPRGGPDALELASDDEEEQDGDSADEYEHDDSPQPLDPRAGRVDVVLHNLPVDAAGLARELTTLLATAGSKAHKRIKICLQRFEQLAKDEYPLKVDEVYASDEDLERPKPTRAAKELKALEKKLVAASDELALRGLRRKHRKRVLARTRSGTEPAPDITSTNGDWAVEATESKTAEKKVNKHKLNHSNKENLHKDRNAKKPKLTNSQTDKNTKNKSHKQSNKHKQEKNSTDVKAVQNKNNKSLDNKTNVKQEKSQVKLENKDKLENKSNGKLQNKRNDNLKTAEKTSKDKTKLQDTITCDTNKEKLENKINGNLRNRSNDKAKTESTKEKAKLQEKSSNKLPAKDQKRKNDIQNKIEEKTHKKTYETPKKVKFVLKNNSMQGTIDYYKSVRQSPNIPYDGSKKPNKTNLKPSTPSPLNPFAKKKLRLK